MNSRQISSRGMPSFGKPTSAKSKTSRFTLGQYLLDVAIVRFSELLWGLRLQNGILAWDEDDHLLKALSCF